MLSLRELQRRTYGAIAAGQSPGLAPSLVAERIPSATQVRIYRNNLRETARQNLAAGYPVVRRLVGESCFRNLARVYVARFPSHSGDLGHFGAKFSRLLAQFYGGTTYDYLLDIAELEWAYVESESEREAGPLEIEALRTVAEEDYGRLRFDLHPAVRTVISRYPVLTVWQAHQTEAFEPVDLSAPGEHVLINRPSQRIVLRTIDAATATFLSSLKLGQCLLDAQDEALTVSGDFDCAAALLALFASGVLVAFRF